jgi:type IV secretory pathway VirB6-like protein
MRILGKILLLPILFLIVFSVQQSFALDVAEISDATASFLPGSNVPLVKESCDAYPGLINKLVQCITHMVTKEGVFERLTILNTNFAGAANAALILYVMIFGLKLSLGALENIKNDLLIFVFTCFFITYVNNTTRMQDFIEFFIGFQNEFANVATSAIYSSEIEKIDADKENDIDVSSKYLCFGPRDNEGNVLTDIENRYNLWQRMDCLIGYILGAHPLVERMGQYFDAQGKGEPVSQMDTTNLSVEEVAENAATNRNYKFNYDSFAGTDLPWQDMANDPYCFFKYNFELDLTDLDAVLDAASMSDDVCIKKLADMSAADLAKLANSVKNDKTERFVTFSLIIIIVGMLFGNSTIGLIVFFTGFFVIILLIAAFAQAVLVYITSLFAIVVLGLFAPLILPTFLFKQTRGIFEKWLQLLISYSLQPGIILCYMAFMIFVLQYMVAYKSSITKDAEGFNIADLHFGDKYKQGFKDYEEMFKIAVNTSTENTKNYEGNIQQGLNSERIGERRSYQDYSLINRGDNPYEVVATETTTENRAGLFSNIGLNFANTNANSYGIGMPAFYFGNIQEQQKRTFIKYTNNPNIDESAQRAQENQLDVTSGINPVDEAIEAQKEFEKEDFQIKIGYMQSLLVILLTLGLTLSFMSNVMAFAGQIAGVSVPAIGKMSNIYGMTAGRMSKIMRSTK